MWSTLARRWDCLVVGVCASKVCTQTAFCTFRQALLCRASHDRALVCSGSSCFRRHPSQVINLSTDTFVPRSCSRCDLPWSGFVRFGLLSSTASSRCSRIHPSRSLEEGLVLLELLIPELLLSLLSQTVVASQSCAPCHLDALVRLTGFCLSFRLKLRTAQA